MSMAGMDGHSHMDMGGSSSGGIPALVVFPQIYWAVVGCTIGVATLVNVINILICRQRLSGARRGDDTPAKPKNVLLQANATATAIMREAASATLEPWRIGRVNVPMPQVGQTFLIVMNIIVSTVLCFVGFKDTLARAQLENVAYRIGFVCLAQIPLLFLLAGKNNIIGFLTGVSYERLNLLHRWFARTLFLFTTIHFGYWLKDWWPFGGFVSQQIRTNNLVYYGVIAWAFLAWIVFSSFLPLRRLNYEFFVIQHLITFACFIGFVYKHLQAFPSTHVWIWLTVGMFFFDRLTRAFFVLYTNFAYFHPEQRRSGDMNGLWATKAEFTPVSSTTTKITICNPPLSWSPGQHIFISCHSVVPLQSHPFTIASIPQDKKIELFVKSYAGGTRRFLRHAEKSASLLPESTRSQRQTVSLEGPYGRIRNLRQFDSVVLFAGSTGATFTMPLLRDIVLGLDEKSAPGTFLRPAGVVTRHLRFVWVVKSRDQVRWFAQQLADVMQSIMMLRDGGLAVDAEISIYCTCDDEFTEEHKSLFSAGQSTALPPREKAPARGRVEEIGIASRASSTFTEKEREKEKEKETAAETIEDLDRISSGIQEEACGDNGTCCCTTTINDEQAASTSAAKTCCCRPAARSSSLSQSTSNTSTTTSQNSTRKAHLLHPSITVLAGRPNPRNIIRKSLEQARGESAVVVCGPPGLLGGVRRAVVGLSDERGVHKGTGAQGIYLHCEGFSY